MKQPKLPGTLLLNPTRVVYSAPYKLPAARGQRADVRWVIAYEYKTQTFVKNGGQQKCLDKALITLIRFTFLIAFVCWGCGDNKIFAKLFFFKSMLDRRCKNARMHRAKYI